MSVRLKNALRNVQQTKRKAWLLLTCQSKSYYERVNKRDVQIYHFVMSNQQLSHNCAIFMMKNIWMCYQRYVCYRVFKVVNAVLKIFEVKFCVVSLTSKLFEQSLLNLKAMVFPCLWNISTICTLSTKNTLKFQNDSPSVFFKISVNRLTTWFTRKRHSKRSINNYEDIMSGCGIFSLNIRIVNFCAA